jgi:hypothetical protein
MKKLFGQVFNALFGSSPDSDSASDKDWWVEVKTEGPSCTYYFGPFDIEEEAKLAQRGYVEDLQHEGVQQVNATIARRTAPKTLTIYDEETDTSYPGPKPAFSGRP